MINLSLMRVAAVLLATASSAFAAELSVPPTPFVQRFAWTGCYLGGSGGGGVGWIVGGGLEWAFSRHWSTSLEYNYYQFGHRSVLMTDAINGLSGTIDAKETVQVVKLGLNYHVWASDR